MSLITACQSRRAAFLVQVLDLPVVREVAAGMGITNPRFISRLQDDLKLYASIGEAPRDGRPPKYTEYVLQLARDYMLEGVDAVWTKDDIVHDMMDVGILPEGCSVEGFWERFSAYMREQGTPVVYGCQRLTFALSHAPITKRLAWAHNHKPTLSEARVGDWWFVDEITILEDPHPKGGWAAVGMVAVQLIGLG